MMQTKFNSVEFISTYVSAPNRYFHQGTDTGSNRLHYWDLNCLRLETESTIGFEALVKTSQFAKHLSVLYTIPSREGGNERLMGIRWISIVRCFQTVDIKLNFKNGARS